MSKKQLNIAVVGWFHHFNAGDDRIGEVLIKTLAPHNVVLISNYNVHLLNSFDLLIFTAGFWHPRHSISRNFKAWYKNIKVPYMAVGLGVEKTDDLQCQKSYNYFVENAVFLMVRDIESCEALGGSDKIIIGPDITWFDPLPICKDFNTEGDVLLNLRPYNKSKSIIQNFTKLNFLENPKFYSLSKEDKALGLRLGFKEENIIEFFNFRTLHNVKLIYGMRFHSSVFSQQQAIPHYNIVYHQKVSSLVSDVKSFINKSNEFATINSINDFTKVVDEELLKIERKQLLENREQIILGAKSVKNIFLKKLEKIPKNNYKSSLKYKMINKIISLGHL